MKEKKRIIKMHSKSIFMIIVFCGLVLMAGTIAWLTWKSKETALVLTFGEQNSISLKINPYKVEKSIVPSNTYVNEEYTSININNKSDIPKKVKIYYHINIIDSELKNTNFKYTITKSTNGGQSYSEYKTGNFSSASSDTNFYILEEKIEIIGDVKYRVYIWYDGSNSNNNNIIGKSFKGELNASIEELSIKMQWDAPGVYEYKIPKTGTYKIELWGAQGKADSEYLHHAKGGYTSGNIELSKNETIFVYVGEQGIESDSQGVFNGGGHGGIGISYGPGNTGGGATDIRLNNSVNSRIMVAGGGGGTAYSSYNSGGEGSYAGGLTGYSGGYYSGHTYNNQNGKGGTQVAGGYAGNNIYGGSGTVNSGTFGFGANNGSSSAGSGSGGGGGGYYGGGGGGATQSGGSGQGGGGGSSYISGHTGCVAIASSSNTSPRSGTNGSSCSTGSSDNLCSIHYSGKKFTNTVMIDGKGQGWTNSNIGQYQMPNPNGGFYEIGQGNSGNGYAKLSYLEEYNFAYTGNVQTFTVPKSGVYKIELWGAQGGGPTSSQLGGLGGYTSGNINLKLNEKLYFYLGEHYPTYKNESSFNGGGHGNYGSNADGSGHYGTDENGNGGGATDVRLKSGQWDNLKSLKSRIMVAGGGGGVASWYYSDGQYGGGGGGLIGLQGSVVQKGSLSLAPALGGNQTSGGLGSGSSSELAGSFGKGAERSFFTTNYSYYPGGGGGYYGGGLGNAVQGAVGSAAGGSSYISGHTGCVAIESNSSLNSRKGTNNGGCSTGTSDNLCSIHYSNKKFTDTVMIDGNGYVWTNTKGGQQVMPNPNGGFYKVGVGHSGHGRARITYIGIG